MDLTKIKELLQGLIDDSTSTEKVEAIGKISGELDKIEQEEEELIQKQEELRKKYIDAIKQTTFKEVPKEDEEPKAKSLEECFQEQIDKRKEK